MCGHANNRTYTGKMASAETSLGKRRNVNSKSAIDSEIVRNSKVGYMVAINIKSFKV